MLDFHLLISVDRRFYVANPASSFTLTPPEHPWTRDATGRDVTLALSQHDVDFLDFLAQTYAPHEIDAVAESLGITREEIATWHTGGKPLPKSDTERRYAEEITAFIVAGVFRDHGAVSNPQILKASPADLRLWEEAYDEQIREVFDDMLKIETAITTGQFADHPGWALARAKLERLCGFLWQCRARLGVNIVTGSLQRAPSQP